MDVACVVGREFTESAGPRDAEVNLGDVFLPYDFTDLDWEVV